MSKIETNNKQVKGLQDWAVVFSQPDPFKAPEESTKLLKGRLVDGGKIIVTSKITNAVGRMIETKNSIYELVGPPETCYAEYCKKIGRVIDLENPIEMIGS